MCKQGKIVNVVLNSNNDLAGSTNSNAFYNVDWGAILKDNTPYKLTWNYRARENTITAASKLAQVQIDFMMEQYLNATSIYGAPTTNHIGCLKFDFINGTLNTLAASLTDNPPIYLANRPHNNTFNVQVLTADGVPQFWQDNAAIPTPNANYILTLCFEELER